METWASAWEWALASGSVIVYIGVWAFHATGALTPWLHYVPCEGVELLEERVLWVLQHPHEGARIADAAYDLFKELATPTRVRRYVCDALVRVADVPAIQVS